MIIGVREEAVQATNKNIYGGIVGLLKPSFLVASFSFLINIAAGMEKFLQSRDGNGVESIISLFQRVEGELAGGGIGDATRK